MQSVEEDSAAARRGRRAPARASRARSTTAPSGIDAPDDAPRPTPAPGGDSRDRARRRRPRRSRAARSRAKAKERLTGDAVGYAFPGGPAGSVPSASARSSCAAAASRPIRSSARSRKQREEGGLLGEVLVRLQADRRGSARARARAAVRHAVPARPAARRGHPGRADRQAADQLRAPAPRAAARPRRARPRDGRGRRSARGRRDRRGRACCSASRSSRSSRRRAKIVDHINKTYSRLRGGAELEEGARRTTTRTSEYQSEELVDMLDANDEAPIIRWVNSLMFQAAKERASDIHIEPGEKRHHRPLPRRRRAARSQARAEEVPAVDHRAREDHGRPQHRREAPAAETAASAARWPARTSTCASRPRRPPAARASRSVCSIAARCCSASPTSASRPITSSRSARSSSGRTASCSSPVRRAPVRRRRSTRVSPRSTRPTSTSSPSRIRSSTSSRASRRRR